MSTGLKGGDEQTRQEIIWFQLNENKGKIIKLRINAQKNNYMYYFTLLTEGYSFLEGASKEIGLDENKEGACIICKYN